MRLELQRTGSRREHPYQLCLDGEVADGVDIWGYGSVFTLADVWRGVANDVIRASRVSDLPAEITRLRIHIDVDSCKHLESVTFVIPERVVRFDFDYDVEEWKGDWTIADYARQFRSVITEHGIAWDQRDELVANGFTVEIGELDMTNTVDENIHQWLPRIEELDREVAKRLESEAFPNAVVVRFDFPDPVKTSCEQYLMYFAEFLRDAGIEARAELFERAGRVLFAVTPADPRDALDTIREALDAYLQLPASPLIADDDIATQKLLANVQHFQGQLTLAKAVMRAQEAAIQAQVVTIGVQQRLIDGSIVAASVMQSDRAEVLGGTVALTKYEGKGFEVNLARIFNYFRHKFHE